MGNQIETALPRKPGLAGGSLRSSLGAWGSDPSSLGIVLLVLTWADMGNPLVLCASRPYKLGLLWVGDP